MIGDLRSYPAYKASGVEWLGDVPAEWDLRRAKHLLRKMDRAVRPEDEVLTCFRDGTVTLRRLRRLEGFTEALQESGYQGIRRGDLVIHQMDAFAGAVGVSDSDGKGTPVYAVCVARSSADVRYYGRVVRRMALSGWIVALAKGIRERSTDFRFDMFGRQVLPLPPAAEQATIVRYLNHVDSRIQRLIEAKERLIELLEEEKQAIIHRAVARGLDPNVPLQPSGVDWLGDVPEHWDVTSLGAVAKSIQTGPFGSQLHASDYVPGGTPVINPSHLKKGRIQPDPDVAVSPDTAGALARHALQPGDLITARRGELGRAALVTKTEAGWLCGTGSMLIRLRTELLSPLYLLHVLGSHGVRGALSSASIGATMDNLNEGMLSRLRLAVPPLPEQAQVVAHIDRADNLADSVAKRAKSHIALLLEYRTRLISDVVTGKLDVREAAERLPEGREADDSALDEQLEEAVA